jgi:hypothetical protein
MIAWATFSALSPNIRLLSAFSLSGPISNLASGDLGAAGTADGVVLAKWTSRGFTQVLLLPPGVPGLDPYPGVGIFRFVAEVLLKAVRRLASEEAGLRLLELPCLIWLMLDRSYMLDAAKAWVLWVYGDIRDELGVPGRDGIVTERMLPLPTLAPKNWPWPIIFWSHFFGPCAAGAGAGALSGAFPLSDFLKKNC